MKGIAVAALFGLAGCAAVAPPEEAERARIRVVVPVPALAPPEVVIRRPPGRDTGAAAGFAGGVGGLAASCSSVGPYAPACMVMAAPLLFAKTAIGAAMVPSNEGLEPVRLLAHGVMTLVRRSDGATLLKRGYLVQRYGRRLQEYEKDGAPLLRVVAGAIDELAAQMVDDAFLLRADAAAVPGIAPRALEPAPGRPCYGLGIDCWSFLKVKVLDSASPTFRWEALPPPAGARNLVYDLWIFGGEDDRLVEGLTGTEHVLDRPLAPCTRYSWAVRARFESDEGPRATDWSTASAFHKSAFSPVVRPTFGSPFITPCAKDAG